MQPYVLVSTCSLITYCPFELASVLLLMAMIGAIVLARRDVQSVDPVTGEEVDQGLIEKARTPLTC
jgi:NAD(P)H-quinone oxidoreductase subunit 6